jgi:hypothetical protein
MSFAMKEPSLAAKTDLSATKEALPATQEVSFVTKLALSATNEDFPAMK